MNSDEFLSATFVQESPLYDPNEFSFLGALLGVPHFDPMGFYHDNHLTPSNSPFLPDFQDQYQVPADFASPGELSSPSLPPSPLSSVDDLDPVFVKAESKSPKADLEGFEYDPITRKWVCTRCDSDFVSTHEARRHEKTAAKCTGKKAECLRCGDHIHKSPYSRKRHFASKKCQKKGRKKGVPSYTVNNAFVEL